jgi:DNA-binding SARP family transcriptional activator/WD40 repeat protein/energy-coupling factor transporter ATP-binding protein EcfA2
MTEHAETPGRARRRLRAVSAGEVASQALPLEPEERGLSFRVLGSVEVVDARGPVSVGGPKERLLLAHLLARVNATVSVDALIDGVWAGEPPRSAERTLHVYVARLRKALGPPRPQRGTPSLLVTVGRGYRLELAPDQLDAIQFEALTRRGAEQLRAGDPAAAAATLRQALGLWRGEPYGEFGDVEACAPEARRLAEARVVALEDRLDADLALGDAAQVASEAEGFLAEHPFRERLWGQLMLALYRAGRQRDALAAYQRARAVLVDELGIEPGPDLRRLEAAILAQDPSLDVTRTAPGTEPGGMPLVLEAVGSAFVGRETELAWLRQSWDEAAAGQGRFVSVLGPEGIGKTRLVTELARQVHTEGAVVLYGRCDHAHPGARALLDQALRSGGGSLARLDGGGMPAGDLAEAVARFLPTWSGGRPVLLFLDDLHLADNDTLEVLADLAGWCSAESMLVVGAFRADAPRRDGPGQLSLGGLDADAVGRICGLYADEGWSERDVARLRDVTDGVPLRVHEQASEWARQRAARRVEEATDRLTTARVRAAASRVEIADSVEGIGRLLEQRRAQLAGREATPDTDQVAAFALCPYKGLARFETADAANFFGRERLVAELVARLAGARLLAVVGPSGSGKSSLVRAGLLPVLATGVLPGADRWRTVTLCPGARPARELARQLRSSPVDGAADRLLVFVDQFEETYTHCDDAGERQEFVDRLVELAEQPTAVVVLAVRADQLGSCAGYPGLADLLTGNDVLVGPMRDSELRRVVELPAKRVGLDVEAGLVEVIVADVAGRAGALPLLSTALAETWELRQDRTLTLTAYRAAGGVNGALARMAEDAYQSMPAGARGAARRVLLRLCDAGDDGTIDLRRRLPMDEAAPTHDANVRTAVEILVDRRLLTVDRDSVEVAHEALLREWPRLRAWLDEDVHGRRLHRRLGDAARAWRAAGEDPSELYRGTRLDGAVDWAAGHDADLNMIEREFLDASRVEAEREVAEVKRRSAERARTNRRLRGLLAGVGVLLVVSLVAGWLFLRQRDKAEREERVTRVRELSGESALALEEDPERSILLALEAVGLSRGFGEEPLPEAVGALQRAVQESRLEDRIDGLGAFVDANPSGTLLAAASTDAVTVEIIDAATGERLRALRDPTDLVLESVLFSPDGALVAASYSAGEFARVDAGGGVIDIWDPETGELIGRTEGPAHRYFDTAFSPDARLIAAASGQTVTVWDVATGAERFTIETGPTGDVEFLRTGEAIVVAQGDERVAFYSAADGRAVGAMPTPGFVPEILALDPTGELLAIASQQSRSLEIWNLESGERLRSMALGDSAFLDWSADGRRLAISGASVGPVQVLDVESGEIVWLRGHESGSWNVAFVSPERLASADALDGLRIWDVSVDGAPALETIRTTSGEPFTFQVSPDGSEVAVTTVGGGFERVDLFTGEGRGSITGQLAGFGSNPVTSPDWGAMASVSAADGRATVRVLDTLQPVRELGPCASPLAVSPDESLVVINGRELCPDLFPQPPGTDARNRVVELSSGREVLDLEFDHVTDADFTPDGRFLAVNEGFERIVVYDMAAEPIEPVTTLTAEDLGSPGLFGPYFDSAGTRFTGGTHDGRAWVFDLSAVREGATVEDAIAFNRVAHNGPVVTALSADGIVASAVSNAPIRVWDVETGSLLAELPTDYIGWPALGFAADGSYLLYGGAGNTLRRFYLDTDRLVELAESRLTRGFTPDECRTYLEPSRCEELGLAG